MRFQRLSAKPLGGKTERVRIDHARSRSTPNKLCVQYGFCLPAEAESRLANEPPQDPAAFTDAVFTLDGLDPTTADRHLYRKVKAVVTEAFRASIIAAEKGPT